MKYYLMAYVSYDWELMQPGFAEDLFGEDEFDNLDKAITKMYSMLEWYKQGGVDRLSKYQCFEVCCYDPTLDDDSCDFETRKYLIRNCNGDFKVIYDCRK